MTRNPAKQVRVKNPPYEQKGIERRKKDEEKLNGWSFVMLNSDRAAKWLVNKERKLARRAQINANKIRRRKQNGISKNARRMEIYTNKLKRSAQQSRARQFTNTLKARATRAEKVLLAALTDAHYWFKFQSCFYSPDHLFIPDFRLALHNQKLIIELDGEYHQTQKRYDAQRTAWLEKNRNCIVIRFTNDQVIHELSKVMMTIAAFNPKKRGKC